MLPVEIFVQNTECNILNAAFIDFRMKKFNIPCPHVQLLRKHVLVMTFIGAEQKPAPKIKDARLPPEDMQIAYDQILSVSYFSA